MLLLKGSYLHLSIKLMFVIVGVFLNSCQDKANSVKDSDSEYIVKLMPCKFEDVTIKEAQVDSIQIETIEEPVAITFFNLNNLLIKYEISNPDSLPEKLRNPDRQEIYRTRDILGEYSDIKFKLQQLSVNIIDSISTTRYLSFKVDNEKYFIRMEYFKENDGVILYNGINKPIFWPSKGDCNLSDMIECYFDKSYCVE